MSKDVTQTPGNKEALWSMSAVTRMTGIGQHTLRAWERRFGFPKPIRLPSGHRRYTRDQVEQLKLIAEALRQGHRAGDIVALPLEELKSLLGVMDIIQAPQNQSQAWLTQLINDTMEFQGEKIMRHLLQTAAHFGTREFLRQRIIPLLKEVGELWAQGKIDVRHEHFLSHIIEDVLRYLRMPLEPHLQGDPLLLCTLPEELHALGLQMVALTTSLHGRRMRILGVDTPLDDIVATARRLNPAAVGLSVSVNTANANTTQQLNKLRRDIPKTTPLWVGGNGAVMLQNLDPGLFVFRTLDELEEELQRLNKGERFI